MAQPPPLGACDSSCSGLPSKEAAPLDISCGEIKLSRSHSLTHAPVQGLCPALKSPRTSSGPCSPGSSPSVARRKSVTFPDCTALVQVREIESSKDFDEETIHLNWYVQTEYSQFVREEIHRRRAAGNFSDSILCKS